MKETKKIKYTEFSGDEEKHIFSWLFDRFDPLLAILLKRAHFLPTEPKILKGFKKKGPTSPTQR